MAKLSQTTREIINVIIFLLVVALLVTTFVIYPLNKTVQLHSRTDVDSYHPDSLLVNDPTLFIESGLLADTFMIESDGMAELATVYLTSPDSGWVNSAGTIVLVPEENAGRQSMLELAHKFIDKSFSVITYDQRACGASSAKYHGEGKLEAGDLVSILHFMAIREKLQHPVTVIGFSLGADAAMLAGEDSEEIDKIIAVNPYLTTSRMHDILKERHDLYWIPFFKTVMWFWYEIRSSYALEYRELEDIDGVEKPTLLLLPKDQLVIDETAALKERTESNFLQIKTLPADSSALFEILLSGVNK